MHKGPDVPFQLYGGTLDGITEHLDHLDALGATLLYLTPVFEAWSNHRYDAVSFDRVDPLLGGDEALARLIDAVHARGLRLIGDLTTNHTGDHHDWFLTRPARPRERRARLLPVRRATRTRWTTPRGSTSRRLPKLDHTSAELARRLYDGPDSVVGALAASAASTAGASTSPT